MAPTSQRTSILPVRAGGALCPAAPASEPETRLCAARLGEVLRFSFTGQIEQRSCYLRCFFRRRFIRESPSDCREPVATGSLVRSTQPVDIFAFALEMLAKFLLTKAARRERALGLSLAPRQPQRNSALKQSVLEPRTAVSFQRAGWFSFPILFCNSVTPSFK